MNKREFLKTSGALVTGSALSRLVSAEEHAAARTNWSGNYTYSAARLDLPQTAEEVRETVKRSRKLKTLGSRHSFNNIADTRGDQISLEHLDSIDLDHESRTVTVGGGVTYSQLGPHLDREGYALHNLASLPQITVAGACATATHGSGNKNGNLATAASAMEIVNGQGETVSLSRQKDGERFRGAIVSLGALGVITRITLDVQPTYKVRQVVYQGLPMARLQNHLDEVFASGYSVSLFTDWQNHRINQVWIKRRVDHDHSEFPQEFFGAKRATRNLHPIEGHSAEACTEQMGIPGPWYDRLPHFRINSTPSSGHELQTEYLIPRDKGYDAILAVETLRDRITPHLFVTELRTIDGDDLWMSTAYKRPSIAIHFTWKPEWPAVKELLPRIEEKLAPFDARPHWAKLFTIAPSRIDSLYAKVPEYRALVKQFDPQQKFRNAYLSANIYNV